MRKARSFWRCWPEENPIDLDFFLNLWPQQKVEMTLTETSVLYMAAGVIFLLEKGFSVNANVACEEAEWSNHSLLEYSRQLGLLMSYYLAHEGKPLIKQFIQPLGAYLKNLEYSPEPVRICGAGDGYFMYDTDGKRYPCHMVSSLVLTKAELSDPESDIPEGCAPFDPRCAGCPYITQYSTCIGCNFRFRGQKAKRDHTHCCVMRLEVRNYLKYLSACLQKKHELSYDEKSSFTS